MVSFFGKGFTMKHISKFCQSTAERLSIEIGDVQKGYEIDSILEESDFCRGLICVAARSGVGKTTFALDLVLGQAVRSDKNILIVSCEKSAEQIVAQLVMKICGLNTCFVNAGDEEKIQKMSQTLAFLSELKIYIEDFEGEIEPDLSDIERVVEEAENPGLVMIDGMYGLWDEAKPTKLAEQESKKTVKHLRAICKRNELSIIITTYFSRAEIKRMLAGDMSNNVLLKNGVDILIALYRSVVGTTISNTTDFLITDARGRYDRNILHYDTKNRKFLR